MMWSWSLMSCSNESGWNMFFVCRLIYSLNENPCSTYVCEMLASSEVSGTASSTDVVV